MAGSRRKAGGEQQDSPLFWFEQFIYASHIGDDVLAWNAQKHLHRLGYVVTLRHRRESKGGAR